MKTWCQMKWQVLYKDGSPGLVVGKRFTFRRLWVRIPAPYTGLTFVTYICFKNCNDVYLKRPKINEKEAGIGPFFSKKVLYKTFLLQTVETLKCKKIGANLRKFAVIQYFVISTISSEQLYNLNCLKNLRNIFQSLRKDMLY